MPAKRCREYRTLSRRPRSAPAENCQLVTRNVVFALHSLGDELGTSALPAPVAKLEPLETRRAALPAELDATERIAERVTRDPAALLAHRGNARGLSRLADARDDTGARDPGHAA